ncbi:hypothetical protein DICPUDRAFT_74466 [Dictyostelium purpureum]|uniref:Uncharacterized protein n=1 Tax=Dictyostelium purpureum TaxID=5786 RepID=F0Z7U1_DICPU|nr:uncharacterized protein DICPUDRAFT_74466 [Dictyostelium purpureum]EGC40003.1 hypothetical protein DICPUDRAFT_74466 [Dictyostelium purpureum]|eukprot:XP_003283506.1 hypothetical protein DICPUDRAFT_74466 [Dictyostelium purpureum]
MNSFKRLFNQRFVRNFSSFSITQEQVLTKDSNRKRGSRFVKFLLFTAVTKITYDCTNSAMAYYKGENSTTESIVDQSWNEVLYPVFQTVIQDREVMNALGQQITLSSPPPQSKTPIVELKRDFRLKFAPIDFTPGQFYDHQWFLQKLGVGNKQVIELDKLTPKEKEHLNKGILQEIYDDIVELPLSEQLSKLPSQYLPLLVPYKNRIFPIIYGESTSDIAIPIQGPKGKANILLNLYASDDKWTVRGAEVIFENDNLKKKQIIKPTSDEL